MPWVIALPSPIINPTPAVPIKIPIIKIAMSSNIKASEIATTASAGSVSKPENGGAMKAARVKKITINPTIERYQRLLANVCHRGREKCSNHLMRRTKNGKNFFSARLPRVRLRQRFGNHNVSRPATNSIASNMTTISNK